MNIIGKAFFIKFYFRENFRIRFKNYGRAGLAAFNVFLDGAHGLAFNIFLKIPDSSPTNLGPGPFRKGAHYRYAHAMKPAGYLISLAAELSSLVKRGHDCF